VIQLLAKRLFGLIPILLGVSVLVFFLVRMVPGDPAKVIAGERASPQVLDEIRRVHGLDQPLPVQYGRFLGRLVQGDLGTSVLTQQPVTREIADRFPATIELTLAAMTLAALAGVALGIAAALRPGSLFDVGTMSLALLGVSVPVFCLGYLLILTLGDHLPYAGRLDEHLRETFRPATGFYLAEAVLTGHWAAAANCAQHLLLPAVALATVPLAVIARITRSAMLDVLGQDFIRTAKAKGVSRASVVLKHALRNALVPIVTVMGVQTGYLLGGAVLTETVFSWPGMGQFVVNAIGQRDYPVIQGGVLLFSTVFVLVNALVDVLYAKLDPRVQVTS
jgi:peptide/nickel transport system permease protein